MTDGNDEETFGYSLELPFVVVQSEGGPFEDTAFAAGWLCGEMYLSLKIAKAMEDTPESQTIPRTLDRQVDLMAMKFGFTVLFEDTDQNEYLNATFYRSSAISG